MSEKPVHASQLGRAGAGIQAAADREEIEKLRRERDDLLKLMDHDSWEEWLTLRRENERLRTENVESLENKLMAELLKEKVERLRGALRIIAEESNGNQLNYSETREIARAALADDGESP